MSEQATAIYALDGIEYEGQGRFEEAVRQQKKRRQAAAEELGVAIIGAEADVSEMVDVLLQMLDLEAALRAFATEFHQYSSTRDDAMRELSMGREALTADLIRAHLKVGVILAKRHLREVTR